MCRVLYFCFLFGGGRHTIRYRDVTKPSKIASECLKHMTYVIRPSAGAHWGRSFTVLQRHLKKYPDQDLNTFNSTAIMN